MANARFRFKVTGADSITRRERAIHVDAESEDAAMQLANEQGMLALYAEQVAEHVQNDGPDSVYEYLMAQIAIQVNVKVDKKSAAKHLQSVVNKHAAFGWDFYRIDPFVVKVEPGCLGWLLGQHTTPLQYHIVTFRRKRRQRS